MKRALWPAITARWHSISARCVLPTPLGPSITTFSARSMNARWASSITWAFGAPPAWLQSNCSSVLTAGIVASRVKAVRLRSSRARFSLTSTFSRKSAKLAPSRAASWAKAGQSVASLASLSCSHSSAMRSCCRLITPPPAARRRPTADAAGSRSAAPRASGSVPGLRAQAPRA